MQDLSARDDHRIPLTLPRSVPSLRGQVHDESQLRTRKMVEVDLMAYEKSWLEDNFLLEELRWIKRNIEEEDEEAPA